MFPIDWLPLACCHRPGTGGQKSFLVDSNMTGGCALLAYSVRYAVSGVTTFIVGQDGVIYENDPGPDTETEAAELTEYNPDDSWTVVKEP